jgi:hypothetical protein
MTMSNEKPLGYWLVDSGGISSFHHNEPDLTFAQSYAGKILHYPDAEEGKQWKAYDKDSNELGVGTLYRVKVMVENHVRKPSKHDDTNYRPAERKR